MVIDISKFLIISPANLDSILLSLGLNLQRINDYYTITLLVANIFAYLVIFMTLFIAINFYNKFLSRRFRRW